MNCDRTHACWAAPRSNHSSSESFSNGVPARSSAIVVLSGLFGSRAIFHGSTSMSQSMSVETFHIDVFAFSYSLLKASRLRS